MVEPRDPNLYDMIYRLTAADHRPDTWEEAAEIVVNDLTNTQGWQMSLLEDDRIEQLYGHGYWDVLARAAYADIMHDISEEQIVALLARKQSDYGPRNIMKFGIDGLKVRLWDKVARLTNLRATGRVAENESYEDTLLDIIGYVTIACMLEFGWFMLPLTKEWEELKS